MLKKYPFFRLILFSVLLLAVLIILEQTIMFGVRNSPYGQYAKVNLLTSHTVDPDIAFFGSSVGEVSIDPRVAHQGGNTAYNFCIDGTRFIQYNGLIKELNDYSSQCKLVVFAETFFSLSAVDKLTEPDRFLAHLNNEHIYNSLEAVQPELLRKLRYIPFYRFIVAKHGYYKASYIGWRSILRPPVTDSLKGFTPKYKQWETGLDELNKISRPVSVSIDSATLNEYRKTIAELRNKGRKVLIIIPPIQADGLRLLPGLTELRKKLMSMEGDGVYFRDYSNINLSNNKMYFYNNSHVNDQGAALFSKYLATTIDSLLVSDKRSSLN